VTGGDHLRAGEAGILQQPVEGDGGKVRYEQEQAAELCPELARREIQLAHIGDRRGLGTGAGGTILVLAPR